MTEHSAKRSGKSKTLTPEELDQVIHHLPSYKHQILALICRNCGCRIQEATLLTWDCFRDNQLTFPYFVTKGRLNTRDVPLTRKFIKTLNEWKSHCIDKKGQGIVGSDYIIPGRYGFNKPLTTRAFMYALDEATERAKIIKFSSHGFRRSALTSANEKRISIKTLQAISGHKSLETLSRYLEISDKQKLEAVNAFA